MAVLRCASCGAEAAADARDLECSCGGLFDVEHTFPSGVSAERFDARLAAADRRGSSGVWAYRELVYPRFPQAAVVTLHEGRTPLYRSPRVADFSFTASLVLKHEGLNPTGSFKDRGMTVAISRAVASGAETVVCASTGNTAASMAAYAACAGLRSVTIVPEHGVAPGKLSQALAYGAEVVAVRGDFDRAMELVREVSRDEELMLLNSANPFRIEGQKSIVFELLHQLDWSPPDWIVFPAGNLGNCAAFGKALREARDTGLIDRLPRLAAVQASGAAPFRAAFARGFDELVPVQAKTVASAIRIGNPVSYARAVRSIRETNGIVIEVDDDEILEAKRCVDRAGIGAEPASCAAVAGVRKLALRGLIDLEETVACILTANLLKDVDTTLRVHAEGPVATVDPSLDALRDAIAGGSGA